MSANHFEPLAISGVALRRLCLAGLLTLALMLGWGTAPADAHKSGASSQVTIDDGGPNGASGHVSSSQPKCERGRRVILYVVDPSYGQLNEVGRATTDRDGEWALEANLLAGQYVAKVLARTVRVHAMPYACRVDLSLRMRL